MPPGTSPRYSTWPANTPRNTPDPAMNPPPRGGDQTPPAMNQRSLQVTPFKHPRSYLGRGMTASGIIRHEFTSQPPAGQRGGAGYSRGRTVVFPCRRNMYTTVTVLSVIACLPGV